MGWLFLGPALFGIWRYRYVAYWQQVAYVGLILWLTAFLFSAGGTLGDPSGDGLVTGAVRLATADGPEVLWCLLPFVPAIGLCIFFLNRLHKTTLAPYPGRTASSRADTARKAGETFGLIFGVWVSNVVMTVLLAVCFAAIVPAVAPDSEASAGAVMEPSSSLDERVAEAAREVNAGTPKQIDAATVLASVTADGPVLVYNYTVETDLTSAVIEERMTPVVSGGSCSDADMRASMREGVTFRYSYTASGGSKARIDVTDQSCRASGY